MKRSYAYVSGLLMAGSTLLFSCQKQDLPAELNENVEASRNNASDCEVAAFRYTSPAPVGGGSQYIFRKQIDASGRVTQLSSAVYQGGGISSQASLEIKRKPGSIILLRAGTTTDTVLIVKLNWRGRPVSIVPGNKPDPNYLPTTFEYNNNRLSAINVSLAGTVRTSRFNYDNSGNLSSINDVAVGTEVPGRVEFSYSSRKVGGQVYLDEPRPFSWNSLSLLEFAGLFPELQPTKLRTGVKVFWANNYKVYDVRLINHDVQNGRLVKYESSFGGTNPPNVYNLEWFCKISGDDDDDDDEDDDDDDDDEDDD